MLMAGASLRWSDTKTTVIPDCRIHRGREAVGINFIAVGLVIALVPWVVDEYGI